MVMKVMLLKDVPGLGSRGEIVDVSEGYAANYLFRRKLAIAADEGLIREVEKKKKAKAAREEKKRQEALDVKKRMEQEVFILRVKAGDSGKLFSAITKRDLAKMFSEKGYPVDKKMIELKHPIKTVGEFEIPVKLFKDVVAEVTVKIEPEV